MTNSLKPAGLLLLLVVAAAAQQQTTPAKPDAKPPATPKASANTSPQLPSATKPAAPKKDPTAAWHKYCAPEGDYCVKYPPSWEPLGDTPDSGGLVIAPPQSNKPPSQWSSITVAATDVPQPPPGKQRPTFDELISVVLDSMQPGVQPRTLERRQVAIDELPAQILKIAYTDENGAAWIEELALIDAEDVIYTVALRCTPEELPTLEPTFKQIVDTWKFTEPEE